MVTWLDLVVLVVDESGTETLVTLPGYWSVNILQIFIDWNYSHLCKALICFITLAAGTRAAVTSGLQN